jgi:membrane protease YdiL (CAAX protease family)
LAGPQNAPFSATGSADPARRGTFAFALTTTLLAAGLPQVVWSELSGTIPGWIAWAEVALVAVAALTTVVFVALRPMRDFLLVLVATSPLVHPRLWPGALAGWVGSGPIDVLFADQVRKAVVAAITIGLLFLLGYSRRDLFLTVGRLDALAKPVRYLFDRPEPWSKLGPISALMLATGVAAFVLVSDSASFGPSDRLLTALPTVVVLSAVNALSEETAFRAAPLGSLAGVLGRSQSLMLVAAYFGIAHYFGMPSGVLGILMASLFGWWVAKSTIETGGIFWAWAIHLVQDLVIFSFILWTV